MATNQLPESNYDDLFTVLGFVIDQAIKELNTVMPGYIDGAVDTATNRVRVQPALKTVLTDGTSIDKHPIDDVPILWPGGGGYSLQFALQLGDPVLLLCSQRGLDEFKDSLSRTLSIPPSRSVPDPGAFFNGKDFVAIPCFWQRRSQDNTRSIDIDASGNVTITGGDITIIGGNVRIQGNGRTGSGGNPAHRHSLDSG